MPAMARRSSLRASAGETSGVFAPPRKSATASSTPKSASGLPKSTAAGAESRSLATATWPVPVATARLCMNRARLVRSGSVSSGSARPAAARAKSRDVTSAAPRAEPSARAPRENSISSPSR